MFLPLPFQVQDPYEGIPKELSLLLLDDGTNDKSWKARIILVAAKARVTTRAARCRGLHAIARGLITTKTSLPSPLSPTPRHQTHTGILFLRATPCAHTYLQGLFCSQGLFRNCRRRQTLFMLNKTLSTRSVVQMLALSTILPDGCSCSGRQRKQEQEQEPPTHLNDGGVSLLSKHLANHLLATMSGSLVASWCRHMNQLTPVQKQPRLTLPAPSDLRNQGGAFHSTKGLGLLV
jgi:hypothetical protein